MNKPTPPSDLWERLSEVEGNIGESAESLLANGWFTLAAYKAKRNVSDSTGRRRLSVLLTAGKIETKMVTVNTNGTGHLLRVYRLKESPCQTEK